MIIRGCKTIAEYAIRQWMEQQGFVAGHFDVTMNGNDATITDRTGDSLTVRYDPATMQVVEAEERDLEEVEELA